ncbi:hypothetical protein POM88_033087 [Heracleum sosnowskyi]|uniref:Uncharacterized protein n=1 Tax=Heracleum sosnowskyi TaxID=360622 RepID=A0AAD8MLI5_9APIA|nr:hypothetical protein POM88_033087 [Heracleum sosnowskyi]
MATPDGSYALPSGVVAVLKPREVAFEKEIEGIPSTRFVADLPQQLYCPLCRAVMKDAVLTSIRDIGCSFRILEANKSSGDNGGSAFQPQAEASIWGRRYCRWLLHANILGLEEPLMLEVCSWTFASFCRGNVLNTDQMNHGT